ncbi:hypothetical protein, partial [uncultured Prevotella sp.]
KSEQLQQKSEQLQQKSEQLQQKSEQLQQKSEQLQQKSEQLKNIVKSLYSKGMNILQIVEITGINKDEVAAILN